MSQLYDALRRAETTRDRSLVARIWRLVPRPMDARVQPGAVPAPAPLPTTPGAPPAPQLPPRALDVDLSALRGAVDRLDARLEREMSERDERVARAMLEREDRLVHQMIEREGKLLEEMRRGMLRLEAELSERFAASVLENRRQLRRALSLALLVAGLGGLGAAILLLLPR